MNTSKVDETFENLIQPEHELKEQPLQFEVATYKNSKLLEYRQKRAVLASLTPKTPKRIQRMNTLLVVIVSLMTTLILTLLAIDHQITNLIVSGLVYLSFLGLDFLQRNQSLIKSEKIQILKLLAALVQC